jgi:hypothetical protein
MQVSTPLLHLVPPSQSFLLLFFLRFIGLNHVKGSTDYKFRAALGYQQHNTEHTMKTRYFKIENNRKTKIALEPIFWDAINGLYESSRTWLTASPTPAHHG